MRSFIAIRRLKKEAIDYLNDLAIEFRQQTTNQISKTVQRAIQENFYLKHQIETLSDQLDTSLRSHRMDSQKQAQLTRTVAVLEDLQVQSAKKHLSKEHVRSSKSTG